MNGADASRAGPRFFLIIVKIATLFSPMRVFLPVSAVMFFTGIGYGVFRILFMGGRYGPTSAMLMTMAVVVFMIQSKSPNCATTEAKTGIDASSSHNFAPRKKSLTTIPHML